MKTRPLILAAAIFSAAGRTSAETNQAATAAGQANIAADTQVRPDQPGAYKVGHITDTATDHRRNRTLRYDVWYPVNPAQTAGTTTSYELDEYIFLGHTVPFPSALAKEGVIASSAGAFPLIIYSHASSGTRWEAFDLCELMASHGYVVFSADHLGDWLGDTDHTPGDASDPLRMLRLRGPDCSFLIDTALARNSKAGDLLRNRIDPRHIGGIGWSYGGFSIAALGGGYKDFCGDSRLDAMVLLSPSTWVLTPAELERIKVPVIALTGTRDDVRLELADAFVRLSGPHMLVNLQGADHHSFDCAHIAQEFLRTSNQPADVLAFVEATGGFPSADQIASEAELRRITALYTVAGFDRYLKNSSGAASWLTKSYAETHEPKVAQLRIGVFPDLNGNDIPDGQDIARGTSRDRNRNGIPDEVDGPVIRVRAGASGNGESWPNAIGSLTRALELARASRGCVKEIWVAAGVYAPAEAGGDNAARFQMRNVEIYGGFSGRETRRDQRDPAAHLTVLTGDLAGNDLPGFVNREDNARHVVHTLRSNLPNILDGFTVRGAYNTDGYGGGLILNSGLIQNCTITDNFCPNGGGLAAYYEDITVKDCLFTNNTGLYGGGIALDDGNLSLSGCRFENNRSAGDENTGGGTGGAVYVYSNGHLTAHNCEFVNNVSNAGGAINVDSYGPPCSLAAVNCLLYGNQALDLGDQSGSGAALSVAADQEARLTNITAFGNTSTLPPWHSGGSLTIHNSIIRDGAGWLEGAALIKFSNIEGGYTGQSNISGDPKFVNAAAGDFHLKNSSPCINKGSNSLLPADVLNLDGDRSESERIPWDLSELNRVSGGTVDMGAYESR